MAGGLLPALRGRTGRGNDVGVRTMSDPQRDQEAARSRDWYERHIPSRPTVGSIFLDHGELERLIASGASATVVKEWLRAKLDEGQREREILSCLEEAPE